LHEQLKPDANGRIPHAEHVKVWAMENRWSERRDELLVKASERMEDELVSQTVKMWREHAEAAHVVAREALAFIKEHGFDTTASAVSAIKWAQEEERKTRGAEAFLEQVKNADNDKLLSMVRELAVRKANTDGDIVDALEEMAEETVPPDKDGEP
jgi:hypothetical protein